MPIYEYRCDACGAQTEILQRISDAPPAKCPKCGKRALKKMVTAAGFQLKGTGWYATDFKDKAAKPAATGGKADKSDKSDKSDKPAASSGDSGKAADTSGKSSSKAESPAASTPAKSTTEKT